MSDTHATSTGTPKKTKTTDILSKIIQTIGVILISYGILYYISGKWNENKAKEKEISYDSEVSIENKPVFRFEKSGDVYATREHPAKACINPMQGHASVTNNDPSREARAKYVLVNDTNVVFLSPGPDSEWHKMPIGDYFIYPIDPLDEGIRCRWTWEQ